MVEEDLSQVRIVMANPPKSSSGYSEVLAPTNIEPPNPHFETKLTPPFSSSLGPRFFPPPIIQPNQIPSPSVRIPSPNSVIQPNQIPLPVVRTPSPNSGVQPNQIPSQLVGTPSPSSVSPANGIRGGSPGPHLSTPPGPPRFSSPLQPAAVPFRTSPASPQPPAFSSGSSLPTSSTQYSNGAFELQHQASDASEDFLPANESTNVLFSANKVPLSPFIQLEYCILVCYSLGTLAFCYNCRNCVIFI